MHILTRAWALALAHPMYSVPLALVALVLLASAINRALPPGPPKTFTAKLIDRLAVLVRRGAVNGPWSWPLLGVSLFEAVRDSAREAWPAEGEQPAPPPSSVGFAAAPVLRFLAAVAVTLALARCAAGAPHVTAVTPRLVQRPEYGTCLEVGGKVEVRGHGVLTQLSSTCWESVMDAGAGGDAGAEASAPEPEAVEGKGDGGGL